MKIHALIASFLLATILCGCSSAIIDEASRPTAIETESETKLEEELKPVTLGSNLENSILLLDQMTEDGNAVFSPLSLNYALGLVAEGSSGQTKEEIDAYLGTNDYGKTASAYLAVIDEDRRSLEEKKNRSLEEKMEFLYIEYPEEYSEEINIANSLWINTDRCELLEDYRKKVEDTYKATVEKMSFIDAETTADKINSWCNDETRGMIPNIVKAEDFSNPIDIVLANALYFESPWLDEWRLHEEAENFTLEDGNTLKTQYLYNAGDRYFENDNAIAFGSYYSNGRLYIGILPKKEGAFNLADLDIEGLLKSEKTSDYDTINCRMPELDYSSEYDLISPLSKLGVSSMFDANYAQIDGIAKVTGNRKLNVGAAKQKAKIELNEMGTRAAAVTLMMMETTGMSVDSPKKEVDVYLDRPYAFLIYDEEQDQVLFIGKVMNPESEN